MKIYTLTSTEGRAQADLHHDGSVDLIAPLGASPIRIEPEDVEDVASLLLLVAARSERMHYDIGSFPERCPFRQGDGIAFGKRCTREVHAGDRHAFEDTRQPLAPTPAPASLSLMPEQSAILGRILGASVSQAELQTRVIRGDEDAHLAEMIDALAAYFAVCRAQLGHDQVPVGIQETYQILRQRSAQVSALGSG